MTVHIYLMMQKVQEITETALWNVLGFVLTDT